MQGEPNPPAAGLSGELSPLWLCPLLLMPRLAVPVQLPAPPVDAALRQSCSPWWLTNPGCVARLPAGDLGLNPLLARLPAGRLLMLVAAPALPPAPQLPCPKSCVVDGLARGGAAPCWPDR